MLTAHSGSDGTPDNSRIFLEKMLAGGITCVEVDMRQSPTGVLYLSHDTMEWDEALFTLKEAMEMLAEKRYCFVNCDLKEEQLEMAVVNMAQDYGLTNQLILSGNVQLQHLETKALIEKVYFNVENIISNLYASKEIGKAQLGELVVYCKTKGVQTINIHHRFATEAVISAFQKEGIGVSVWTVNDKDVIDRFQTLGVRNVTTRQALAYREYTLK